MIERGTDIKKNVADFFKNLNPAAIGAGFVASMFSIMGPGLIVLNAAKEGNLTAPQAISWLFILYITGGILTIFTSLYYRLPVVVAYSIPGAVLIGGVLKNISLNEAVGAYILTGIIVVVLGISGLIKKITEYIPLPVMLAMIAGVLLSFGLNAVRAVVEAPAITGSAIIVFFLLTMFHKLSAKIPPILGALVVGGIAATLLGQTNWSSIQPAIAHPIFTVPHFTVRAFLEVSLPFILLIIGTSNMQAIGMLYSAEYKPPINALTTIPGIGTIIHAFFGGHPSTLAGVSTAIVSGEAAGKDKDLRYIASMVDGTIALCVGLSASMVIAVSSVIPSQLLAVLGGLAILGVLIHTFNGAFSGKFKYGSIVAFLIALSNVTIFSVGAPFWALVGGFFVSVLLDRSDYGKQSGKWASVAN